MAGEQADPFLFSMLKSQMEMRQRHYYEPLLFNIRRAVRELVMAGGQATFEEGASDLVIVYGECPISPEAEYALEQLAKLFGEMGKLMEIRKRRLWRQEHGLVDLEPASGLALDIPEEW